jgi:hypothetical protein
MILPQFFDNPFTIRLSFHKMIERYTAIADEGKSLEAQNARAILADIADYPELRDGITDVSQILSNSLRIARLVGELFPQVLTKNEIKAITVPYQGLMFNYTERFRNILEDAGAGFEINIRDFDGDQFYIFSCGIILNRFYGTSLDFNKPLFYDIPAGNGTMKYYRIFYNTDFTDIFPADQAPELSETEIRRLLDNYDNIEIWKEKFPPKSWVMKGFTIMTLTDVTIQNAISILKDHLLGKSTGMDLQQTLSSIFRSIFQINDIQVGLSIYHRDTNRLSDMGYGQKVTSFILFEKDQDDPRHIFCDSSYDALIQQKKYFAVAAIDDFLTNNPGSALARIFKSQQFKSFIIAPVIKNGILIGLIELVSSGAGEFNSVNATKLDLVMPFLVDAIEHKISEFEHRVMSVIQSNYTSLHRSVNWKFEREAKSYISSKDNGLDYNFKEIHFRKVFPLYGQVDIRNSSRTRNLSVKTDLNNQLKKILSIVQQLGEEGLLQDAEYHTHVLNNFLVEVNDGVKADTEQSVNHYLELEIYPLLKPAKKLRKPLESKIQNYFRATDSLSGNFYAGRRKYESTLSLVNDKLLDILDKRQAEIQQYFPHYYERFKTDGVEHNLYMGSAIAPDQQFSDLDLQRLRLWQLLVIAEMQMKQFRLKSTLPYHLGVTTLILVFTTPIDIRFRMDEKHFDMDGAYNIRYEVIKKRIDKALIKGSSERITHQNKLTIVYSKKDEEKEYLKYLAMLQEVGLIGNKIESLEIEKLQGVSGLRALRATFLYDERHLERYSLIYEELYQKLN